MWDALKHAMRIYFVPPYYQRSMLTKLARLDQGKNSIEDYYQELQTGMLHCGIEEDNEALLVIDAVGWRSMYLVVMPRVNLIVILSTYARCLYSINCPTVICLPSMCYFYLMERHH
jgi:hypothetical protein